MRLAIHQPEFMPWAGFFYKMHRADTYVVLDHVQYKKRYFENRNLIVSPSGEKSYIGVPVKTKGRYTQAIRNVEIDNSFRWKQKMLNKIRHFYAQAEYFQPYYGKLETLILGGQYDRLIDLNMSIIGFFRENLAISTPIELSSDIDVGGFKGSDLILQICILKQAKSYLCGISGVDYLRIDDFLKKGISLSWLDYGQPAYRQLCKDFIPKLSTLDLLFNHGPQSIRIIAGK